MGVKNPAVAFFFVFLGLAIVYAVLISMPAAPAPLAEPFDRGPDACVDGTSQACSVGSCSGISTCVDGIWSGCRWQTVCTPGSRAPCFDGACLYAVKECNGCGTGFSECFNP